MTVTRRRRRTPGGVVLVVAAAVLLTSCSGASSAGSSAGTSAGASSRSAIPSSPVLTPSTRTSPSPSPSPVRRWLSGASSDDVAEGRFDAWRGSPAQIGGTWDNGNAEQLEMHSICSDGTWSSWNKPLDVAVGAIDVDAGESWAAAARGAYVKRWRAHLTRLEECWGTRDPALLYIRFAHEMNLPQKWRVRGGQEAAFVKAITLYSDLRYEIIPEAKIVLCTNDGTDNGLGGLDIRKLWPGRDAQGRLVANLYAVDSYNKWPHVTTAADFKEKISEKYRNGMPLGIETHRQFAEQVGVPFAVPEWGNQGRGAGGSGESPVYMRQFNAWARAHAGDPDNPRPGQLVYEVMFNLWTEYRLWPQTIQPRTAAAYRDLTWGT